VEHVLSPSEEIKKEKEKDLSALESARQIISPGEEKVEKDLNDALESSLGERFLHSRNI